MLGVVRKHLKIIRVIILLVSIDVMDYLRRF